MRVVLDTNILISGFLWQGSAAEIFRLAQENKIKICVNKEIIDEFKKVLDYSKFNSRLKIIEKTTDEVITEFLEVVKYYPPRKLPEVIIPEDPSDDKFLACASISQASFIVSGDKHLLKLEKFQNIPIVSPRDFLEIINK